MASLSKRLFGKSPIKHLQLGVESFGWLEYRLIVPALSELASEFQGSRVELAPWLGRKAIEYCLEATRSKGVASERRRIRRKIRRQRSS
ncbi:hypothetical protein DL95DRAFT_399705, partial [Leptodontidium sp. 2 PMI_412]